MKRDKKDKPHQDVFEVLNYNYCLLLCTVHREEGEDRQAKQTCQDINLLNVTIAEFRIFTLEWLFAKQGVFSYFHKNLVSFSQSLYLVLLGDPITNLWITAGIQFVDEFLLAEVQ